MKLGIMQPYFFPYIGYFDLINYTDKWIVFDAVQYIRHGWVNRNRVLHPTNGWQYIIVPLKKHSKATEIKDIEVVNNTQWRDKIIGQLQHYRKKAPYFSETIGFVKDCLSMNETSLSRLNVSIIDRVCTYLNISMDLEFFSEMKFELGPINGPGDWALRISEAMGAKEYVNSPGGVNLLDNQKFKDGNIKLNIRKLPIFEYSCKGYEFIPNLSIIDLLMWNEPEKIKRYLDAHI